MSQTKQFHVSLTCPAGRAAAVDWWWCGAQVVGEPHGAELTGEGGGGRRGRAGGEAKPKQGTAWSVQLHADTSTRTDTPVHRCESGLEVSLGLSVHIHGPHRQKNKTLNLKVSVRNKV